MNKKLLIAICYNKMRLEGKVNIQELDTQELKAPLHEATYQILRDKLAKGVLAPGQALSLRKLAAELGGSVTPVRDSVWRLAAEHSLHISPTRRISVPNLTIKQMGEILGIRALLEPEAAGRALFNLTPETIQEMRDADNRMNEAITSGDVTAYMSNNHAFHFALYRASRSDVLLPMIESLWVRFGPFMRLSYPDVKGMKGVADHHQEAFEAIENKNEKALRRAIISDVKDCLNYIVHGMN